MPVPLGKAGLKPMGAGRVPPSCHPPAAVTLKGTAASRPTRLRCPCHMGTRWAALQRSELCTGHAKHRPGELS